MESLRLKLFDLKVIRQGCKQSWIFLKKGVWNCEAANKTVVVGYKILQCAGQTTLVKHREFHLRDLVIPNADLKEERFQEKFTAN